MNSILMDITFVLPEMLLLIGALSLLLWSVYSSQKSIIDAALLVMVGAFFTLIDFPQEGSSIFYGMLVNNDFTQFAKVLILLGGVFTLFITMGYLKQVQDEYSAELPVLILLSVVGMMLLVSSNNLISLYMGLELQSLCLYVLASFNRRDNRSTEAGLKYFVLGALSSGILLYGSSLIYGYLGTTDFIAISVLAESVDTLPIGALIGLVMVIIAICFKISAVPFHMWTPDVYEGAPTPVTAFFAYAPKVSAIILAVRLLLEPFGVYVDQWQQVIIFVSIASMVVGALGALQQFNIKRLMAYSSIGHMGYLLVGLASATQEGIQGMLIYLALYLPMSLGMFACIMMMRRQGEMVEKIEELSGLSKTKPLMALSITVLLLSMAGIPPLAGFFGKFYVFMAAVDAGLWTLAIVGVLSSVIAAFYYIRIIKVMYFDEVIEPLDVHVPRELWFFAALSSVSVVLFFTYPSILISLAEGAVSSLFS